MHIFLESYRGLKCSKLNYFIHTLYLFLFCRKFCCLDKTTTITNIYFCYPGKNNALSDQNKFSFSLLSRYFSSANYMILCADTLWSYIFSWPLLHTQMPRNEICHRWSFFFFFFATRWVNNAIRVNAIPCLRDRMKCQFSIGRCIKLMHYSEAKCFY